MEKLGCLIGIITACFVTILVLTTDIGSFEHTVKFSSQETALNTGNQTTVKSTDLNINNRNTNISNKNVAADNKRLAAELKQFDNSTVNYYSTPAGYENKSVHFYDTNGSVSRSDINNLKTGLKPTHTLTPMNTYTNKPAAAKSVNIEHNPQRTNYGTYNSGLNNQNNSYNSGKTEEDRYIYKNLDWSRWRSNFINRITDDSVYIDALDKYPQGTMFQYSFTVDSSGKIYNIKVRSFQLSKEDKDKIVQLIKSYEYKEITRFPPNSKRTSTKVSAILLLSDKTEYSTPSDFHDLEQVKIKL